MHTATPVPARKPDARRPSTDIPRTSNPAASPFPKLQRSCACGGSCPRCNDTRRAAPLLVSCPGDRSELEADRIADGFVRRSWFGSKAPLPNLTSTPSLAAASSVGVARASSAAQASSRVAARGLTAANFEAHFAEARREAEPLDASLESQMESALGRNLGAVRVHHGPRAALLSDSLSARAFTRGDDIFFNRGEYDPKSLRGQRLVAHEVAHTVQQRGSARDNAALPIQRAEKIDKTQVRIFSPETQISAKEVALLAEKKVTASGSFDLVVSSGSTDAGFTSVVEKIAVFVTSSFSEPDFRTVLALDFSLVDWRKAGVADAATKTKFGSGLHAFELVRWDGGTKLQLRMTYLREVTELKASDSEAKIKAGKKKFASASFSFASPTAAQKKLGHQDWSSNEKDIVYMAVSRLPDSLATHADVTGIAFHRVKKAGTANAQYDQTQHRVLVGDDTYQVKEGATTTTLSTPSDLYKQSSAIYGDTTTGFISNTEYTIIHEIAHALDWGPVRPELKRLIAASERYNQTLQQAQTIADQLKKAKNDVEKNRLEKERARIVSEQQAAKADIDASLKVFGTKTTLAGATFAETSPGSVGEVNPASETKFEKAISGKVASTPYAATDTGEAFAEGLAQYIVNPTLLKEYRPDLHAYFAKLLP